MQRSSGGRHSFKSPGRFIHSKWTIEMRGDEHSEMSPSLVFDGLAVRIVRSANLIFSNERFGLHGKQRSGWGKIEKFDFHAHAGCSLANLDNLELMAINVSFICRQSSGCGRAGGVQSNGNHDK